ncbi:MAG TPA: sigma factor-like helix-turn-helix DNA-binding protein, partial [Amycolatopsis sp.]|nr:sigma factor-like helix-turn-helix DNA-binding protein [Amycolatopsis sp.]
LQVQPLFRHLPETHRRVLAMRVVLGYSAEETARLLGMPSATAVRVAQFRAIKRLRAVLPGPS